MIRIFKKARALEEESIIDVYDSVLKTNQTVACKLTTPIFPRPSSDVRSCRRTYDLTSGLLNMMSTSVGVSFLSKIFVSLENFANLELSMSATPSLPAPKAQKDLKTSSIFTAWSTQFPCKHSSDAQL